VLIAIVRVGVHSSVLQNGIHIKMELHLLAQGNTQIKA
jgi:hypothetical protein